MKHGYVYFISDNNGHIKIGVTEDVQRRLKELQTGNAQELTLLLSTRTADMSVAFAIETHLHRMFANDNTYGEWFRAWRVMKFIKRPWISVGGYRFRGLGWDWFALMIKTATFVLVLVVAVVLLTIYG